MLFEIIVSKGFAKEALSLTKKYRSIADDIEQLMDKLIENPTIGTPLGNNCYKIRLAITSKGKGKSGGARVITCVKIVENNVHLVSIFDKSEMENIADKELKRRLKIIFEEK